MLESRERTYILKNDFLNFGFFAVAYMHNHSKPSANIITDMDDDSKNGKLLMIDVDDDDYEDQSCCRCWLGCMLTTTLGKSTTWDVDHRLQAASRAFNANRWILCDSRIAISRRLGYFDCVISPVACYAAGHGNIYKQDLHRFDVLQRRFLRSVVGPPRNVDWTQPWHEILHHWNGRIQQLKCKPWSEMCLQHHWNLAHYFALLPDHRWFKRVLHWNPCGRRRVGRPKNSWDTILENFCRLKGLPSWEVAAMDQDLWSSSLAEFLHFCK